MNLLPKSREEFSQKEYWDTFFKKRGNKAFEWYGEYPELCEHIHKYIKTKDEVLIVGCGNSTLGNDLYDIGYEKITNIDISQVVIRQMINLNEKERPLLKFVQMDALNMTFEDDSFSAILDKGTLDALMPNDAPETIKKIDTYFNEIRRVLRTGGRYVCVSLLQEHILKKVLDYFPTNNWMFRAVRCHEAERKATEKDENVMPVFLIVTTKFKALPMKVLEINLGSEDKMQRLQNIDEVLSMISSVQQAAFVCSGLKRSSIADQNEVSFDLFKSQDGAPRFTVYVVDIKPERQNAPYAAFIVPQGREAEWLFSTKEGRKDLTKMTKHNRLAIVTMHRGQTYENLDAVKSELNDIVKNLAPASASEKIAFLSMVSDVGRRVVRYQGNSKFSGDYVVEDVEGDQGQIYRRLYYLQSQLVIQSEARLKKVKTRKGKSKEVVDLTYLTCNHHIYMSMSAYIACKSERSPSVAVVGLGGGGLCSFLNKFIPHASIKAIDIDEDMLKVASEWFGLNQGEKLRVEILDGVQFLEDCASTETKYDAVLFDIDSKDSTIGMSCPPKQFLEPSVLDNVISCLQQSGLFILNIVLRDKTLRLPIITKLKEKFQSVITYKLEEDLNEVVICSPKLPAEDMAKQFSDACTQINNFFKKSGQPGNELIELEEFIKALKIN